MTSDDYGGYTRTQIRTILEWDWAYTDGGHKLHHVAEIVGPLPHGWVGVEGRTTCGMNASLYVPGMYSRIETERCRTCCKRLNIPSGVGSPKNTPALREWARARIG